MDRFVCSHEHCGWVCLCRLRRTARTSVGVEGPALAIRAEPLRPIYRIEGRRLSNVAGSRLRANPVGQNRTDPGEPHLDPWLIVEITPLIDTAPNDPVPARAGLVQVSIRRVWVLRAGSQTGSQTGSQRPRSPANAHAHSTAQIGLVPVFFGRPRTCTATPWVHDAQGVGGSSPSWRTPKIVGNWRFSTVRGPSVARFGASGVCSAFWHPLLEPVCDIRVQRLPTPSTRSPLSGPHDRRAWTQDLI